MHCPAISNGFAESAGQVFHRPTCSQMPLSTAKCAPINKGLMSILNWAGVNRPESANLWIAYFSADPTPRSRNRAVRRSSMPSRCRVVSNGFLLNLRGSSSISVGVGQAASLNPLKSFDEPAASAARHQRPTGVDCCQSVRQPQRQLLRAARPEPALPLSANPGREPNVRYPTGRVRKRTGLFPAQFGRPRSSSPIPKADALTSDSLRPAPFSGNEPSSTTALPAARRRAAAMPRP
jgi:hypothetical protein